MRLSGGIFQGPCRFSIAAIIHKNLTVRRCLYLFNQFRSQVGCHGLIGPFSLYGCGIGKGVCLAVDDGYEAYGIDLPKLSRFWSRAGNDARHFLCCDARRLPFRDDFFDLVWSLGVIEHIGTVIGHCTLSEDYWEARRSYAKEILRVTRPGGRIMIDCPNKSFPIDICHGPIDDLTPKTTVNVVRTYISRLTGINIHRITQKYHLLSYGETKKLFCDEGGAISFEPLPLKGYFSFGTFESGFLKVFAKLAKIYVNNLPRPLRRTPLNPYMSVLVRK